MPSLIAAGSLLPQAKSSLRSPREGVSLKTTRSLQEPDDTRFRWLCLVLIDGLLLAGCRAEDEGRLSLAGEWRFALDRQDVGSMRTGLLGISKAGWPAGNTHAAEDRGRHFPDTPWNAEIQIKQWNTKPPFKDYVSPENFKFPFWLQPDKYTPGWPGTARHRDPDRLGGKHVFLRLERPHWETRVWIDDRPVGRNDSLSTGHEYASVRRHGSTPPDDTGGQPDDRGHRSEFALDFRPHSRQLERHRRADRLAPRPTSASPTCKSIQTPARG